MKRTKRTKRKGAALLVVLLIVMAITVLSMGFLTRSDVELACGQNMGLRTQMDYLAESGLLHARGLILNPQDLGSEYWTGADDQQLIAGSDDYYDVQVVKLGECNYQITCEAYRESNGEQTGRSSLRAELRLDPSIVFWVGETTAVWEEITIDGDVYCNGTLTNRGSVDGDVFANALTGDITGQLRTTGELSLQWPRVTVDDFTSHYPTQSLDAVVSGVTLGPYDPTRVCYRNGNLELAGSVQIEGMLVVAGDLLVRGTDNSITAPKNLPALLVTGDLRIEGGGRFDVNGLVVVDGDMEITAGALGVDVLGGLFVQGAFRETTVDSSDNGNGGTLHGGPTWRPSGGQTAGAIECDGIDDKIEDQDAQTYLNGLSAVTVSLWVKSDVTNVDRGIMFTRDPTGSDEDLGMRYDRAGAFGHGSKNIKASIRTTGGYTQIESKSNAQTTAWQHLALVWQSGSSLSLYINGELDDLLYDHGAVSGTVSGVQKLMLGCGTKGQYWDGMVDDLRIYDRALDPNDIYPPVDGLPGLLMHWKLDESGTDVDFTASPSKTAVVVWSQTDVAENWCSADGAFFRSIERQ
jgi:hypothetical protein